MKKLAIVFPAVLAGQFFRIALSLSSGGTDLSPALFGALIGVSAVQAMLIAWLAARMTLPPVRLFFTLFIVLYGAEYFMSQNEAPLIMPLLGIGWGEVALIMVSGLPPTLISAAVAARLYGEDAADGADALRPGMLSWAWRLAVLMIIWPVLYFTAGMILMLSQPDVAAFYGEGAQALGIETFFIIQLARSLFWTGLAILLLTTFKAGFWVRAISVASSLSVLYGLQLLYPNDLIPWEIRRFHFPEVFSEIFVFVMIVAMLIENRIRRKPDKNGVSL